MIQANPNFLYQHDPNHPLTGLPIHKACEGVMCEKIDLLLDYDPSQAKLVDEKSKMLPLHLASTSSTSIEFDMETFRQLIQVYPQAAKEKDVNGRLPLHHACGSDPDRSHDFVSELLKSYPEAAQIRDNNGKLPLHHMQKYFRDENSTARQIEKPLVELIETYPDALLQRENGENRFVLSTLAYKQDPLCQVWHTAGRLCTHSFLCATQKYKQPLHYMSYDLPALVANFIECPLDWTKNEGEMQDGELAGIILHYTFEALLQANHGIDSNSNSPSRGNVVRSCLPDDNNGSTFKTTLLHKLAYCSKFCYRYEFKRAVKIYASRQSAHFHQADNNGNLPLHLVCCAPPPSVLVGEYKSGFRKRTKVNLVESFLTPYMEGASKTNHLGKTPLDILMETDYNIKSWPGVELLVNANKTEANKLFTKKKMYPFMLAAIGKKANLSCTFSMLLIFVSHQNLDDLGNRNSAQKIKRQRVSRK